MGAAPTHTHTHPAYRSQNHPDAVVALTSALDLNPKDDEAAHVSPAHTARLRRARR